MTTALLTGVIAGLVYAYWRVGRVGRYFARSARAAAVGDARLEGGHGRGGHGLRQRADELRAQSRIAELRKKEYT